MAVRILTIQASVPRLAKETMRRVVLLALAACAVSAGSPSGQTAAFAPNLSLRSTGTAASAASSFVGGRASAGLCSASLAPRQDSARASRLQSVTPVKMAGLYDDDDVPKVSWRWLACREGGAICHLVCAPPVSATRSQHG